MRKFPIICAIFAVFFVGLLICSSRRERPLKIRNGRMASKNKRNAIEMADGATHNHTVNPFLMNHDDCSIAFDPTICGLLNNNFDENLFAHRNPK